MYYFLYFIIIISLGFGADYFQPVLHSRSIYPGDSETFNFPDDGTLRLVGIMAQFPIEVPDNPKTSGDGQFLYQSYNEYINFYNTEVSRCDGFVLDPPPHDSLYFVKQLEALYSEGDLLVAISASGNSPNLLKAVNFVKKRYGPTIGLTGFDGGKLKKIVDYVIHVPTDKGEYGPVEDIHMIFDHIIGTYLMYICRNQD